MAKGGARAAVWGGGIKILLSLFFALLPVSPASAEDAPENMCISCHLAQEGILKQVALDWQNSAHALAGIMCQDCHGGNPNDASLAMEPSQGFKKKPEKDKIPQFCARCHSDSVRMRSHNLRTDQFEKYSGSVHGKKLIEGKDLEAPSCVSCHGQHEIRKVDDPLSSVNRKNIVNTCAKCHTDKKIMDKRHIPVNQYELYKGSLHGRRYFERGDTAVPTCINCHSNHGIQKPQQMSVRFVCAECHVQQADAYKKSGHWRAAQDGGKPLCVHCHSNHGIEKPTPEKFRAAGALNCQGCHGPNTIQMDAAARMFEALTTSRADLDLARYSLMGMEAWSGSGFETSRQKGAIARADKIYKEMVNSVHAMDVKSIQDGAADIKKTGQAVVADIDGMLFEIRKRKVGLIATWIVAGIFSVVIWRRAKYCKRD